MSCEYSAKVNTKSEITKTFVYFLPFKDGIMLNNVSAMSFR